MNYYIIENKILAFENEFDNTLYDYQKLNEEQKAFYELHKCSLQEVLNLELNAPYVETLQDKKDQKLQDLEDIYMSLLEAGYYDETEDITLAIKDEDRKSFTELLVWLKAAEPLGMLPNLIPFKDINKNMHQLTISRLTILIVKLGFYYQTIWATYDTKQKQIEAVATFSELDNIELG